MQKYLNIPSDICNDDEWLDLLSYQLAVLSRVNFLLLGDSAGKTILQLVMQRKTDTWKRIAASKDIKQGSEIQSPKFKSKIVKNGA